MASLMDSVLPFEACLYHQVIPLSIEASHLNLGMVNPDDTSATDYVRRQIAYINYSLVTWTISSDWHRETLSKYLSYKSKTKPRADSKNSADQHSNPESNPSPFSPINPADQATFIVDSPSIIPTGPDKSASSANPPNEVLSKSSWGQVHPQAARNPNLSPPASKMYSSSQQTPKEAPLALNLPTESLPISFPEMGKLPPERLTQALLNRVLQDGIGRLYFERRETVGRILWSKDGIVQAALDGLPLPLFQSVINEFKRFTHLPLLTATKPQQVEIERTYRQERVVLRFRLIVGTNGEEATLQVLRGAALKFYQQQQINQLGRDALTFAHRLQSQVAQIRERSHQTFTMEGMTADTLTTLSHLLKDIDTEINALIRQQP